MNKDEASLIVGILQFNYPDSMRDLTDDALTTYISLWQSFFTEEPYELVEAAVRAHIATSTDKYMPNIGQIKEQIRKLTAQDEQELSETQAWALVSKALRNGTYGYKEEYAKLPPAVQRAVGNENTIRDWASLDAEMVQSVIASNFMRSYRSAAAEEREMAKLPPDFRETVRQLADKVFRPLLEEGDKKDG